MLGFFSSLLSSLSRFYTIRPREPDTHQRWRSFRWLHLTLGVLISSLEELVGRAEHMTETIGRSTSTQTRVRDSGETLSSVLATSPPCCREVGEVRRR